MENEKKITQEPDKLKEEKEKVDVRPAEFPLLNPKKGAFSQETNIEMLFDVPLQISAELGRTSLPIKEILQLAPGSVVELDKLAGEPVDLLVNGKLIAKGEVVVTDENFGVRIIEILGQEARIRKLQ